MKDRVCCNCAHCIRRTEDGKIYCYCEVDGAMLGYVDVMTYWCRRWRKGKVKE